jgi:hypothetical protein
MGIKAARAKYYALEDHIKALKAEFAKREEKTKEMHEEFHNEMHKLSAIYDEIAKGRDPKAVPKPRFPLEGNATINEFKKRCDACSEVGRQIYDAREEQKKLIAEIEGLLIHKLTNRNPDEISEEKAKFYLQIIKQFDLFKKTDSDSLQALRAWAMSS